MDWPRECTVLPNEEGTEHGDRHDRSRWHSHARHLSASLGNWREGYGPLFPALPGRVAGARRGDGRPWLASLSYRALRWVVPWKARRPDAFGMHHGGLVS